MYFNLYRTLPYALAIGLSASFFSIASADTINCSSGPDERVACAADTSSGVALSSQSGDTTCLLGKNWGYDDNGVWVAEGCSASFVAPGAAALNTSTSTDITTEAATDIPASAQAGDFNGEIEAYGRLRGHLAYFKGKETGTKELEIQDNVSWLGLNLSAGDKIKAFAKTEWQINIFQNDNLFNPGGSTNSKPIVAQEDIEPFALRLGYIGVDLNQWGSVAFGKQWGAHYDIAGYTADHFYAFGGGVGSLAYVAGTDGGESGTGRADQALAYRNRFANIVELNLQAFLRSVNDGDAVDGYAASLRLNPSKGSDGIEGGISYTRNNINPEFDGIPGIEGDAEYMSLGARYASKAIELGLVFAKQKNGDVRDLDADPDAQDPVGFDGKGWEFFGKWNIADFSVEGGYVNYQPELDDPNLDKGFQTQYYVFGGEYRALENFFVYTEYRLDKSVDQLGNRDTNVLVLGLNYYFSISAAHQP